jgi:hypothetical protein
MTIQEKKAQAFDLSRKIKQDQQELIALLQEIAKEEKIEPTK